MAYNKTTWNTGDIVTAEKLNNLEQGVTNAQTMVLHGTETNDGHVTKYTLDYTFAEIKAAFDAGVSVKLMEEEELDGMLVVTSNDMFRYAMGEEDGEWIGDIFIKPPADAANPNRYMFIASSADGYPEIEVGK